MINFFILIIITFYSFISISDEIDNINDEVTINWEEKNTNKRNKLLNIINESF